MTTDDCKKIKIDLAQVARLALGEKTDDIRLFIAKLVRQYRDSEPVLSEELAGFLRTNAPKSTPTMMRRMATATEQIQRAVPIDGDSQLALLKKYVDEPSSPKPILSTEIETTLDLLIKERQQSETLAKRVLIY